MSISIDDLRSRLNAKNGKAQCPAHDDASPSLSIGTGADGRVLLHCHAGCTPDAVCNALGIKVSDLFADAPHGKGHRPTVAELATAKRLSAEFLGSVGVVDLAEGGVGIQYRDEDGNVVALKKRTALVAKEGSRWEAGKPTMAYGVDRLFDARELEQLVIVEGESDCWTLWHHEIPALGIPGADNTRVIKREYIQGIKTIYFVREPDKGGDTFAAKLPLKLAELGFTGNVLEVRLDGAKDPSDLHVQNPSAFKSEFSRALEQAKPAAQETKTDHSRNENGSPEVQLVTIADALRSKAFIEKRRTIPTGFEHVDQAISGGLKSKQQSIVAAPTGTGKTGLVGTMVLGIKAVVLWVCTELAVAEQAARFAALTMRKRHSSHYTADELLSHVLPPEQIAETVDGLPVYLCRVRRHDTDPFGLITGQAKAIADKHGAMPVIVVDYIQKLATTDIEQRRLSTSDVSERLLDIADTLDTHTLCISSVSRAYYSATARKLRKQATEEDPRDWLACGKESGDLEYDAALVTFLDVGDTATIVGDRPARLIVAKSRQGGEGFYGLRFHGPTGLFVPDEKAASELKATEKPKSVNLDKLKVEIRRLLMKRRNPFTSKTEIADRIDQRRIDVWAALDEMFDAGELTQAGKGKPIAFTPPGGEE